jgi:DNA polymerase type B, organellar and viral
MAGIMRRICKIRPNHGTEIPSSLIFVDTETVSEGTISETGREILRLRLGVAQYVRIRDGKETAIETLHFTDSRTFWDWVATKQSAKQPLWIWAHNLGFDLTILDAWKEIEDQRFAASIPEIDSSDTRFRGSKQWYGVMCLSGRPTFLTLMGHAGKVCMCDLGNYLPHSLATIGSWLGLEKLAMPAADASKYVWEQYCLQDVVVLREAVCRLLLTWQLEDCGGWKTTAGGLAMTNWRHISPRGDDNGHVYPVTPIREENPDALEREAYMGGWVEAFYIGEVNERIYHLDIQSCYPSVMRTHQFPTMRVGYWNGASLTRFRAMAAGGNTIARVLIDSPNELYPVRFRGRLCMCNGCFWTTLCGPELHRAWANGHIKSIGECARYDMGPIFGNFVNYWWSRRVQALRSGDYFDSEFAKLILNSLSGKWGQSGKRWVDSPHICPDVEWGHFTKIMEANGPLLKCRAIAGNTQVEVDEGPPDWGMPCISAFITSHAREVMRQLIALCPRNSVYHIATDSLLVSESAYRLLDDHRMIESLSLGKLKLEAVYSGGVFRGQNNYRVDDRVVRSGAWGRAKEIEKDRWYWDQWQGLPEILSEKPDGTVSIERIELTHEEATAKGNFQPNGWSIPFCLREQKSEWIPISRCEDRWNATLFDSDT